ncbi:MAG: hypothetical protein K8W52_42905 [Deltaproteobacteria bacterium]|nr:hypothetical protein [Deltaproteobacteria bacterium]
MLARSWFALVVALAAPTLAGCPRHTRHTLTPQIPSNGDPQARHRFEEARARFERDGSGGDELAAIARDFPDDPIAPYALLLAGVSAVQHGEYDGAVPRLQAVLADAGTDAGLRGRGELYLGLALGYLGRPTEALPHLGRGEPAIANDDERGEWTAANAVAVAAGPAPLESLPWFDRWWPLARAGERGYILARVGEIVDAAPADRVLAAWAPIANGNGPAAALLAPRAVAALVATGEGGGDAKTALERGNRARKTVGLPAMPDELAGVAGPVQARDGSTPGLVGAAVPETGKQERLGELALHGLAVASGALGGAAAVTSLVADVPDAGGAAAAIDTLADGGAMAVIGPIDGASVDAAAERAITRGAFEAELERGGGSIAIRVDYPAAQKSFADTARKLKGSWRAVFIPEQADRLELIAPALGAAGLVARPLEAKKAPGGRPILVLSTAEGAGPELLRDAGRHLYGAWLAPGFFADPGDAAIAGFVERYGQAFGKPPTSLDAYAYDAALAIATAAAASRAELGRKLASGELPGVTGAIKFDADHRRADDGVIFVVEDDGAGGARVKAQR